MEHIELLHIQQDEEADTDRPSVGEHGARDIPVKHGPADRTEHEISPMILGKVQNIVVCAKIELFSDMYK